MYFDELDRTDWPPLTQREWVELLGGRWQD